MKVQFYLRDSALNVSAVNAAVRFMGKKYKLPAGVSVEVSHWDKQRYRVDERHYPDADAVNVALSNFETKLIIAFKYFAFHNQVPTTEEIKSKISNTEKKTDSSLFLPFFYNYYNNANYSHETWKKYNTSYNWLVNIDKLFREI